MIITSRNEKFYNIEMTAAQASDIQEFLIETRKSDAAFMSFNALHGPKRTDEIRESLTDFLNALEGR